MFLEPIANQGKKLTIVLPAGEFLRLPIKTHVITDNDEMIKVCLKYAVPLAQPNDYLFISERVVAISQGRAWPIKNIKPSLWANWLVKFVHQSPYGIGLKSPWTMELAMREAGLLRMLLAAFCSAVTKPFGLRGVFYRVVGKNINAIDGPCSYTLPPYNEYAKLGPKDPDQVAEKINQAVGLATVIIDANDLGVNILGKSDPAIDTKFCEAVFKDNPLGQSSEQTPLCLVRKVSSLKDEPK